MNKKDILGKLIKKASKIENIFGNDLMDQSVPLEEDSLWIILNQAENLGLRDTSTNIDQFVCK